MTVLAAATLALWAATITAARLQGSVKGWLPGAALAGSVALAVWVLA